MEEKRNVKKRILITVVILFLIQLLAGIPTPGVNLNYFKSLLEQNTTAGLFDVLSGNGLSNLSITMISITPYICYFRCISCLCGSFWICVWFWAKRITLIF